MLGPYPVRATTRRGALLLAAVALMAACARYAAADPPTQVAYKPGFPFTITGGGTLLRGAPAVADLGLTPGWKSIVFGTTTGQLFVVLYDGATASVAPGFPVTLPARIDGTPAVGDVTGDGIPDIVVGYGSNDNPVGSPGGIRAYTRAGGLIWGRALDGTPRSFRNEVVGAPAIGDVDGDGQAEVAFGAFDAYAYVVKGSDGTNEAGWPVDVRDTIWSSPALHDLDLDGKLEVILGVDAHLEGPPHNTPDGGCLHVWRSTGARYDGFPVCVDQTIFSAPAVGDIDGDGKPEIVFGTGTFYPLRQHKVYALECNGTPVPGWPVSVDGEVSTAPALADLTGDGVPEVVVTDGNQAPSTTFHVYAFSGAGAQLWKTVPKSFFGVTPNADNPLVADVLGNGDPEVLVPVNSEIVVLSKTGVQLTNGDGFGGVLPSFFTDTALYNGVATQLKVSPVAGDPVDVIAVSGSSPTPPYGNTIVRVFVPKTGPTTPFPWPLFHQNAARTGVVPGTPACVDPPAPLVFHTLTPCRAVDTRDSGGTFGGPPVPASGSRSFPLSGRCGIPADAKAVALNATVVSPAAPGYLTLYPGGTGAPLASTVNFRVGQVRANNAVVKVSTTDATVAAYNGSTFALHVLLDVVGYFR